MSSDTSFITVLSLDGPMVRLRDRPHEEGQGYDYTRSFALNVLREALERAEDLGFARPDGETPLEAEAKRLDEEDEQWFDSESFMEAHLDAYIASTEIVEQKNVHDNSEEKIASLRKHREDVEALGLSVLESENKICEQDHYVVLEVRVADPKWLEGLRPGLVFGSTSYDVWLDDPKSHDGD